MAVGISVVGLRLIDCQTDFYVVFAKWSTFNEECLKPMEFFDSFINVTLAKEPWREIKGTLLI